MILTPFRVYRLPEGYERVEDVLIGCNVVDVETFLAYTQGDQVCEMEDRLVRALEACGKTYSPPGPLPMLHLNSNCDCELDFTVSFDKASLRRAFQLIDDFCEDYPDKDTIELPFCSDVVREALGGLLNEKSSLKKCLDCLRYLNPKDNTLFFRYDVEDVSEADLHDLASKLTLQERHWMLEARDLGYNYPLPMHGLSWDILGYVFEVQRDIKMAKLFFSACPRYLVQFIQKCVVADKIEEYRQLLLNESFYNEPDIVSLKLDVTFRSTFFGLLIDPTTTWEQIGRLLAMVGVRDKALENERVRVRYPCEDGVDAVAEQIRAPSPFHNHLITRLEGLRPDVAWKSIIRRV